MAKRTYYRTDDLDSAFRRVLLIERNATSIDVYCPPGVANGPWTEPCSTMEAAMDLAALITAQIGHPVVLMTRDKVEWWLEGLSLIGDSDQKRLEEEGE